MLQHPQDYDVGVLVARFQVPDLTVGHKQLIETVCAAHDKVIIFLGLSPLMVTANNPLDFEARKQMILAEFPNVNVLYIKDEPDDDSWSRRLDAMVDDVVTPSQKALLYGSRDSFINHYTGKLPTQELVQEVFVSGRQTRREVARRSVRGSEDFRAGAVWAAGSRFPTCYPTVDVAILNEDETQVLLGRKENEKQYRFIGGFADPGSPSYEADAKREVMEETGLEVTQPEYIGSFLVDDWRYRNEVDKIKTLLFEARRIFGSPKPDDDIFELKWFDLDALRPEDVVETHRPLLEAFLTHRCVEQQS